MINFSKIDVVEFCKIYQQLGGLPFHAVLTDPPYHLSTITKRFGTPGAAPAKFGTDGVFQRASKGFMGQTWDGGDIAFQPATWEAVKSVMYPGAFGMAFSAARNFHRIAAAIEDAGFIIHPMIGWVHGQGFPKATRVKLADTDVSAFDGHRYGLQAMKPALEPIIVYQKPFEGRPLENILGTGAGTLNVDAGRIGSDNSDGRWPANFIVQHLPGCKAVGSRKAPGYSINRWNDDAHPFGGGAGHEYTGTQVTGLEEVIWECQDGCPVKALDEQGGITKSKQSMRGVGFSDSRVYGKGDPDFDTQRGYEDEGGVSRYFLQGDWSYEVEENLSFTPPQYYSSKANGKERNFGVEDFYWEKVDTGFKRVDLESWKALPEDKRAQGNMHATVKPLQLVKYLAGLLLPPTTYAPRRIFIPFCGVGSEAIGASMAGWESINGVDIDADYLDMARARANFWETKKG